MSPPVPEDILLSFANLALKLDKSEDVDSIIAAIKESKDIQTLNLSGNTLGIPAAESLGKALEDLSLLQHCILSDLFTGRMKNEIAPALRHLSSGIMASGAHLVELDLSDNAFGPNGVVGVTDLLASPACFTLKVLRMNNQGLGHEGCRHLCEALRKGREASHGRGLRLQVFTAGRNRLENVGAEMLSGVFSELGSLEELSLYQNGIGIHGIDGVKSLLRILKGNPDLRKLDLSDNTITPHGCKAIAKTLVSLNKLEELYLSDCLLKSAGTRSLAAALSDQEICPNLRVLNLTGNEVTRSAAISLTLSLGGRSTLELLDLNANEFGGTGIRAIVDVLKSLGLLHVLPKREGHSDSDASSDDLWQSAFDDDQGSASEEEDEYESESSENSDESCHTMPNNEVYENGVVQESPNQVPAKPFSFRDLSASLSSQLASPPTSRPFGAGGLFSNLSSDTTDAAMMRSKLWSTNNAVSSQQTVGGLFAQPILSVTNPPAARLTTDVVKSHLDLCLSCVSDENAIQRLSSLLKTADSESSFSDLNFDAMTRASSPEDVVRLAVRLGQHVPTNNPTTLPLTRMIVSLLGSVLLPDLYDSNPTGAGTRREQAINCLLVYLGAIKAEHGSEEHSYLSSLTSQGKERHHSQCLHIVRHLLQSHASKLPTDVLSCLRQLLSDQQNKETNSGLLKSAEAKSMYDEIMATLETQISSLKI